MMMTKSEAIAAIQQINTTANAVFLAQFSNDDLHAYLDRLTDPGVPFGSSRSGNGASTSAVSSGRARAK
ncbi:MAG: hypothetical protein AABZ47_11240 [Planctomycetota bacterium]